MHPDDVEKITKIFDQSFAEKKEFTVQYRLKHDSEYKLILSKGKPNYTHDGQFTGYIGSCVEMPSS
jgi:hypothetical protein